MLNVNIVGNLTNNNGVLSGFSHGNYAEIPDPIALGNNFEIVIKTNFGTSASMNSYALSGPVDKYLVLGYDTAVGGINFNIGYGDPWLYPTFIDRTLRPNADVWFKITYDGRTYKLYKSYDGIEYGNHIAYFNSTTELPSLIYHFGDSRTYSATEFPVYIDLNECYIKVNNQLVWEGVSVSND